jgi:hypothetical protein
MPISDYACALFFAHQHRVTLKAGPEAQKRDASWRLLCLNARIQSDNADRRCRSGVSAAMVSGAAELHQAKIRCETTVSPGYPPRNTYRKRKSPAEPGF